MFKISYKFVKMNSTKFLQIFVSFLHKIGSKLFVLPNYFD
jgi:hypothetical protein